MKNEIILIQHSEGSKPGVALSWLQKSGRSFRHLRMDKGDAIPEARANQSLILCGGGMHVDQEDRFPWLKLEKKVIEDHLKLGNKVVGLCLGGQLCAEVLGAAVYPHENGWEVGWLDVTLQVAPLSGFEVERKLKVSQYHRYVFEAPQSSQILAVNDWWPIQAYLWNKQVLGFQFHPERDLAGNLELAQERDLPTSGMTQGREEMLKLGEAHYLHSAQWFESVLTGFLKTG